MSRTTTVVADAVISAVREVAFDPGVNVAPDAIAATSSAVIREVAPVVEHLTNQEPWYQSRVTWGAIISAIVPILGALGVATDWIDPDELAGIIVAIGAVVGSAVTLWGRWRARKPIGA